MDTTKFTMGIVGLVVIILMVTGAVIPAVEDAQKDQYSTDNNTNERYLIVTDTVATETNPLILELSADNHFIINGVEDTQAYQANYDKMWGLNISIRVHDSNYFQAYVWTDATTGGTKSCHKLVYDGSVLTGYDTVDSVDTEKFTVNTDFFIYPYSKGTYGQFSITNSTASNLHINKDANVFVGAVGNTYEFLKGTYADGFETVGYVGNASYDASTLSYTAVLSEDSLTWSFGGAPSIVLTDSTEVSEPLSNAWVSVYAPIEYKYISDSDSSIITLVGIIPLLLIIVAVLYAVRLMGASRN